MNIKLWNFHNLDLSLTGHLNVFVPGTFYVGSFLVNIHTKS